MKSMAEIDGRRRRKRRRQPGPPAFVLAEGIIRKLRIVRQANPRHDGGMFENRFTSTRPATPALKDRLLETMALGLACLLAVMVLMRAPDADSADARAPTMTRAAPTAPQTIAPPPMQPAAVSSRTDEEIRRILQDMALHD